MVLGHGRFTPFIFSKWDYSQNIISLKNLPHNENGKFHFLFCIFRWPKLGAVVGVILAVGFSVVAAIVNLIHDLPPSPLGLYPDPEYVSINIFSL